MRRAKHVLQLTQSPGFLNLLFAFKLFSKKNAMRRPPMAAALRVRKSIQDLQDEYVSGNKAPLETLMRAWKGIKELPPEDPRSFFALGGLHGEPFRGAGWGNSSYWGGYCNHGNIL